MDRDLELSVIDRRHVFMYREGHAYSRFLSNHTALNAAAIKFLRTDVETGLIFTARALATADPAKRERNRRNASRVYDTVLRLMGKFDLTRSDARFIHRNLQRLRSELLRLGELFEP